MNQYNFSKLPPLFQSISVTRTIKKIRVQLLIVLLVFSSISVNANPIDFGFIKNFIIAKVYSYTHTVNTEKQAYPNENDFKDSLENKKEFPFKIAGPELDNKDIFINTAVVLDPCTNLASTNGIPTPSDSDGDGVNDVCDLDDDNDGILDSEEGCGLVSFGPIKVVFILDTSGSIDGTEYAAMTTSINNVATQILANDETTEIAIVQYGGNAYVSGQTARVSRTFSTTHPNWTTSKRESFGIQDHLPASLYDVRSFWEAGGPLDLTVPARVSFIVFTDAWRDSSSGCCTLLKNSGTLADPNALPDYGEYEFIKDTYNVRFLVGHHDGSVLGGYEAAKAIASYDNNGVLLVSLGTFTLSQLQIDALAHGATFEDTPDFDLDEVANCNDLDSDNDGIYDILESGDMAIAALDTNNNGKLDKGDSVPFVDVNKNGLDDRIEAKYGTSIGITPRETIATRPDYINLDSDGDGCFDTDEAYLDKNTSLNDGGEYGNVDAKTVSDSEIAVDGTVVSASYQTPATTASGQNTFQSAMVVSITSFPITQSGCIGSDIIFKAKAISAKLATNPITTAIKDVSYQWYENDVLIPGESGTVASGTEVSLLLVGVTADLNNNIYKAVFSNEGNICGAETAFVLKVSNVICEPCTYLASTDGTPTDSDADGDGINNVCDLDADNDGILNENEGGCGKTHEVRYATSFTHSGIISPKDALGSPNGVSASMGSGDSFMLELDDVVDEGDTIKLFITRLNNAGNYRITSSLNKSSWSNVLVYNAANGASLNTIETVFYSAPIGGAKYIRFARVAGGLSIDAVSYDFLMCTSLNTDTDNDAIPDYLDLDSDGDGCPDALEGSGTFLIADLSVSTMDGGNSNISTDPVQDNLTGSPVQAGAVDVNGIPVSAAGGQEDISSVDSSVQAAECDSCNAISSLFTDGDGDGVGDDCDLDKDNDGILDVDEGYCSSVPEIRHAIAFVQTGILNPDNLLEAPNGLNARMGIGDLLTIELADIVPEGDAIDFRITRYNSTGDYIIESSADNVTWTTPLNYNADSGATLGVLETITYTVSSGGAKFIRFTRIAGALVIDAVSYSVICTSLDTDGDDIPDYLDLDSDNDGCPDALEGGDGFTYADLDSDTSLGDVVATSGTNIGVPTITSDGNGQTIGSAIDNTVQATECDPCNATSSLFTDNDLDGVGDACDLDDDNDGILDVDEGLCEPKILNAGAESEKTGWTHTYEDPLRTGWFYPAYFVTVTNKPDNNWFNFNDDAQGLSVLTGTIANPGLTDYLSFDMAWNDYREDATIKFVLNGIKYAEFNFFERALGLDSATITYYNGASGPPSILKSDFDAWISYKITINFQEIYLTEIKLIGEGSPLGTRESGAQWTTVDVLIDNFDAGCGFKEIDTDGDGVPDHLDLDSDNDGCPDAIEGAGDIQNSDLDTDSSIDGAVDANGIPTRIGVGQAIGGSVNNLVISIATITNQLDVLIGSDITFTAVLTATAVTDFSTDPDTTVPVTTGFLYQWYKSTDDGANYTKIEGATASAFSSTNVSPANDGLYKVAITHADNSCPAEQIATLSILPCELTSTLSAVATSPTTCSPATDGKITISNGGLFTNTEYVVTFKKDGAAVTTFLPNPTTDASGEIVLTGLSVGEYTEITVESATVDTCSISIAGTATIVGFINTLSVINTDTEETSFDANDGTITIIPSLGLQPYVSSIKLKDTETELWTGETTSGLVPGIYNVLVTDANGCTFVNSVVIEEVAACTVEVSINPSNAAILCFGDADITLTANTSIPAGSSATNPLIYVWTDGTGNEIGTNSSVNNLGAGTYKVVVTSIVGGVSCEGAQETFTILQPPAALTATISSKDVISVSPGTEGEVLIVPSGGTEPYTFAWVDSIGTPIGTTAKITGLTEGTYSVIVTDANACVTGSLFTSIAAPGCFSINNDSGDVALDCNGNTTNLVISLYEDSGNTTITWTSTDADLAGITVDALTLSGVGVGTYKATVVDNILGCTKTTTLNITENAALSGSIDVGQVGCKGAKTGTLDLSISGGTNSYTYLWSSTDVDLTGYTTSNQDLIGVPAGSYAVLVTDGNNCKITIEDVVVEPSSVISATVTGLDEKTFEGNDGAITIIPLGGTPEYTSSITLEGSTTELWTAETTINLAPGLYNILVTDGSGCTYSEQVVIEKLPSCNVDVTITSSIPAVLCFGDATITLTANTSIPTGSSATNPLIYVWTDGTGNEIGTSSSVSGLGAGTYKVVVSSTVGGVSCEGAQEIFKINQPSAMLTATISSKDVISVSPGTEGEVNVVASGGTPEYTYAWVDSIGTPIGTTAKITGLTEGTYSVIVTDANGCVTSSLFTSIAAPGCFSINNDSGDVALACNGDTTNLVISLNEDSGNTTITWTSTDADLAGITVDALTLSGVGVGTYKATVIDNVLGCTKTTTLNITENAALSGSIDVGQVGCKGAKTGTLDLSISGGTNSYTYLWSSTDVDLTGYTTSNQDLIGVPAGSYAVLVTDGNNCKITIEDVVVEPNTNITITSIEVVDESCSNCEDGQITVTAAGGTGAYLYSIDAGDIKQEENIFENLLPGVYTVTVYDANGCFVIQENVTIIEDVAPDYKPVIYSGNTQIDKKGNIDFVVLVGELLGNNSDGITPVELRIIKNLNVVYSFDTSITTQGGRVVNNSDWIIDESHSFYVKLIYIGNGGIFIGDTASLIGISAHLIAPNSEGVFPITATVKFGSGGEVRVNNNVDRELMKFTK